MRFILAFSWRLVVCFSFLILPGPKKLAVFAAPSPRYSFALAYDESRQRLVLFGGFISGTYLGDTWEWDGQMWQQVSASGPSARAGHKLVFDSKRKTVLLYGGFVDAGPTTELWEWDGSAWKMIQVTSVREPEDQPQGFLMQQNFPNPFNPNTTIAFQLSTSNMVSLKIYDVLGQEIVTVLKAWQLAGAHEVNFDAAGLPGGIYFYRLQVGAVSQTRKMIIN